MKIAIHQPEFMPWLGFFQKMYLADKFIIFDHVQFKKRYFENRNQIVSSDGNVAYITVPVLTKNKYLQAINSVKIDQQQIQWKKKILNKISIFILKALILNTIFLKLSIYSSHFNRIG